MRALNILFVVFIIGLFFTSVEAADWILVFESKTLGEKYYLDAASVSSEGVIVTSWQKDLDSYKTYSLTKNSINCETKKIRLEEVANYYADGRLKESFSIPLDIAEWHKITPDSIAFEFEKFLCKDGKPRPLDEISRMSGE